MLLAEEQAEKRLYAIERTGRRKYVLCRLGAWVMRQDVERQPSHDVLQPGPQAKRQTLERHEIGQPWWTRAAADTTHCSLLRQSNERAVPKLSLLPTRQNISSVKDAKVQDKSQLTNEANDLPGLHNGPALTLTADEHFQELAKQYLEALYIFKTSLAYFTKGPLSRIRAAFVNPEAPDLPIEELVLFLRNAILTSAVTDKKYREGISGVVKELAVTTLASSDPPAKAKKRKWKFKRDKQGMFSHERDYIEQWWTTEETNGANFNSAEGPDVILQRRTPGLRSRETYLQIVLALEVLALEASLSLLQQAPTHEQSDAEESQHRESQGWGKNDKKSTARKSQDLPALLETLIDKLCIWHSLSAHSPAQKSNGALGKTDTDDNDELRSFCIEVVIPFYMSRIPEHALVVNRKLGGPSAPSPGRRKPGSRRPGEPAVRQPPVRKPRMPLTRVSTDTLNQTSKPVPSLHRAATDSDVLPRIKRESSETSIPPVKQSAPAPAPRKRTSLMHSISLSKREVDLSAMSEANRTKMRKKAEVEEKLKEAITTLKRPNRALAVKEVAESADMSFAKATARSRPPAHSSRARPPPQGVHVAATPRHVRTVKASPDRRTQPWNAQEVREAETSFVPSSSSRLMAQASDLIPPGSTLAVPQTGHRPRRHEAPNVEETPSRGFAKFMPPALAHSPGTLRSPDHTTSSAIVAQTPSKKSFTPRAPSGLSASPDPVRRFEDASSRPRESAGGGDDGGGESIYDALGWEEEGYESLA